MKAISKLSILTVFLLIFSGCVEKQMVTPEPTATPTTKYVPETPEQTTTSTPIPKQDVVGNKQITVTINNSIKASSLKWYTGTRDDYPTEGNIFLIINLKITNNGYESFSLWKPAFRLISNSIAYHPEVSGRFLLENELPTNLDVLDGGSISGNIVFELPKDIELYEIKYEQQGYYNLKNIVYTTE